MSWRIPLILAAVAFAVLWSTSPNTPRITEVVDRPVAITALPCIGTTQATLSGFVIDDELVVTVAHGLYGSRDFAVRDADGVWHDGFVLAMDLDRDLSLVQVEGLRASPIATARVAEGDPVQMVGGTATGNRAGQILRPVRLTTEVIGDMSRDATRRGYEVELEISGGDSGAGIVDASENLVAVVFSKSKKRDLIAWVTAMSEVEPLHDSHEVPTWTCGKGSGQNLVLPPLEDDEDRVAG